jgi:hypothetical protein
LINQIPVAAAAAKPKNKPAHQMSAGCLSLVQAKLPVEFVNTPAGVHQLLFAGVKGVTLGTNFNLYVLFSAARFNDFSAGAPNCRLLVVGMEPFLHYAHLFLSQLNTYKRL